ncbi:MAG: hypothetical protein K9H49_17570 [Bacteroidales bacterium]|nr:hypothetical protein [Bacteroidales bacterium]MCF8391111.1 hypothetical protein [Bacteroidales bacterium]
MKKLFYLQIFLPLFILNSCETENNSIPEDKMEDVVESLAIEKISGYVQKGPYLNGTSIAISELSSDFIPTGKVFSSQILDNKGTFEIKKIDLISQFVELKADGFYFNELTNGNSSAQLTLYALADLTDNTSLNVNILSNLEKGRLEYILSDSINFSVAKQQALSEILSIFEVEKLDIADSELLDITKPGDDNAILLAISVIIQGNLSVADLSELLANMATDIREDGVLDSKSLGTQLINNARIIHPEIIRENLESRYESLGQTVVIPDFEKYLTQFIENTSFEYTNEIDYPETGRFGENVLGNEKSIYSAGRYSISAILPEATSLVVTMTGNGCYLNNNPYDQANFGWEIVENPGILSSAQTGAIDIELLMEVTPIDSIGDSGSGPNIFEINVFENGALIPTWTKEITFN